MKKQENVPRKLDLSTLKKQIPQLKETKQGQLKGGFVSLSTANSLHVALSNGKCTNLNTVENCTCS